MTHNPNTAAYDHLPSRPIEAQRLHSDAEAIACAHALAETFRAHAITRDRERQLPFAEVQALRQSGLTAISVPKRYGGLDASAHTIVEVFRAISAADPSLGQIPQNHFCFLPVFALGTEAQAEFFYGRMLAGDTIGNAHSENSKKRPGEYEHDLRRVDNGWRISGKKYYSTGAAFAQWIPFIGLDEQGRRLMFFAAADQPGVEVLNDWKGMGQRCTASGTTVFHDVFIPDFHVFPLYLNDTAERPYNPLAALIHSAIDLGICDEVLKDAKHYIHAHNRPWTGNPHEHHAQEPFVIQEFGSLVLQLKTAQAVIKVAADALDTAWRDPSEAHKLQARLDAADARIVCGEACLRLSEHFFSLTGARATLESFSLDRHWRNARTHTLHDPLRWKKFHLGNYYLNGITPASNTYI